METYCSYVSVALGIVVTFAAKASYIQSVTWRKVLWAVVAPKCIGLRNSNSHWHPYWLGVMEFSRFEKCENRFYLLCDDLHIVDDTSYRFGAINVHIHIYNYMKSTMIMKYVAICCVKWQCWWDSYQNDADSVLFSDDIDIVGDITYKFVVWLGNRHVWNIIKLSHQSLLNQEDSSVGTYRKWCTCQLLSKCCHFWIYNYLQTCASQKV